MVHSIEAYCSGLLSKHNGFMRFLFSLLSNFMFPLIVFFIVCSSLMFAPQQNTVRLESNGILMTCIYNILILTPKGLTPDYAAGNRHRAFSRY